MYDESTVTYGKSTAKELSDLLINWKMLNFQVENNLVSRKTGAKDYWCATKGK